ncbi:phospholipase-like protein, partial [Tanacetum coccineum]
MLDSILCPLCDHTELEGQDLESFSEWQSWFLSICMSAGTKNLLDRVFATFWWNATVRRWGPLYVDLPTNEDDWTTYSIFGYTWAFKTWILESFRVNATRYYERLNQYPRVAAWRKRKGRFTVEKVLPLFEGNIPIARLTPDDIEARSDWWISSKAYFDGFIDQVKRVPFDVSRQNMEEIPSDRWTCDLSGDGEFKVKVIRNFIDDLFLPSSECETRWVKFIPIKVNVFFWRARRDRLPTRVNLSRRGVLLDSHLCPLCNAAMEDV